jgi:RNA polymerase sigma-70 factor (ECF subfamily)
VAPQVVLVTDNARVSGAADGEPLDPLEEHLIRLAVRGDEQAFAGLVSSCQHQLYRVALRLTADADTAQDVVQVALLQAWQHLPGFRGEARFATWVTRIVINRCRNLRRRPAAPLPLPDETADDSGLPSAPAAETLVLAEQRRRAVRAAVASLPFDQRAPLVLTTFAGYTHADAARILGISEGAAKVRAHRARRALADRLREWR